MTTMRNAPVLPDVLKDAQAWVRKLHSGSVSAWEAEAFRRWRDADPARRDAFQEAVRQWQLLQQASGQVLRTQPEVARVHRATLARPERASRRAFVGMAVGGAAAAGVAAYAPLGLWPSSATWGADYRTAAGEQRRIVLDGGVKVALNTRTSLRSQNAATPGLELIEGEAAIDTDATGQAFRVAAGAGQVLATRASFEVRHLGGRTCVTCLRGQVQVLHPAGQRLLAERQQAVYDSTALSGIARVDPEAVSAWQHGELQFLRTPLPQVIDEINRYRPGRVVLMAEAPRSQTVTARIKIAEIESALVQIEYTFDLKARSLPSGIVILS